MNRSNPAARPRSLLVLALAFALLIAGFGGASNPVTAQGGEEPAATDQAAPLADETWADPSDVPEPPPTPTETPPVAPTEPSAEPTIPPTEEPTEVPAEPAATSTPSPTATVTSPSAGRSSAPASIPVPACSSALDVSQNGFIRFTCTALVGAPDQAYTLNFTALTPGWEYRPVISGGLPATWRSAPLASPYTFTHQIGNFNVDLRPANPSAPATGSVTVVITANGGPQVLSFPLNANGAPLLPPSAADFTLACAPQTAVVATGTSQTVSCTVTGTSSLGQRAATLSTISVTMPSGWTVTSPQAGGPASGGVLTLAPGIAIGQGGSYTFSLALAPTCAAPTARSPLSLASTLTFNGTTFVGPTAEVGATASRDITASLTGITLPPVTYSTSPRTNTGSMTLTVQNPSRCAGWGVTISGTDLVYSGATPNQAAIPAGNMRITPPGGSPVPLGGQPYPLITGGGAEESYIFDLKIGLDIPGGSATGAYTTTITIATTAAP